MTADRLDLDALEATAHKAKDQQYRPVMDAGVVLALIAEAREAKRQREKHVEATRALGISRDLVQQTRAERDTAQAALARVEALHVPTGQGFPRCERDDEVWPCATIRAVASEGQEAGGK